jgi:hypothetical protein
MTMAIALRGRGVDGVDGRTSSLVVFVLLWGEPGGFTRRDARTFSPNGSDAGDSLPNRRPPS